MAKVIISAHERTIEWGVPEPELGALLTDLTSAFERQGGMLVTFAEWACWIPSTSTIDIDSRSDFDGLVVRLPTGVSYRE